MTVSVDAVLSGHDDKVYAAVWHPPIRDAAGKQTQPAQLLTASMDKAMVRGRRSLSAAAAGQRLATTAGCDWCALTP